MKSILSCLYFILTMNLSAQQPAGKPVILGLMDTYVVRIKIDSRIVKERADCLYGENHHCNLYRITVLKVLECPHTLNLDSNKLFNVKFFVAPCRDSTRFRKDSILIVTATPVHSDKYIALSKIVELDAGQIPMFKRRGTYITGVPECKEHPEDAITSSIAKYEAEEERK